MAFKCTNTQENRGKLPFYNLQNNREGKINTSRAPCGPLGFPINHTRFVTNYFNQPFPFISCYDH